MQLTYGPAAITEKKEMLAISIECPGTKNNNYRGEEGVPFAHNQESLIFTV